MGAPAIRVASHEPSITPTFPRKGQFLFSGRFFLPLSAHESRRLLAFPFIPLAEYRSGLRSPFPARPTRCSTFRSGSASRALPTAGSTVRFANFCDTVKVNCFTLSHESVTCHRSPEVSSTAFAAQPPEFTTGELDGYGLRDHLPARHHRPPMRFSKEAWSKEASRCSASVISPLRFAITSRPSRCEED
jgi:hypothetical protein